MASPLISVVLPVYNAGVYLLDAVASIVEQEFDDWELICVNDGSSDQSGRVLDWFAMHDRRIRVLHQRNQGLVAALNNGCGVCRGSLIMRMDNDDIAFPDRMRLQADFMLENPECVVLGGGILEMDSQGDPLCVSRLPTDHRSILDNLMHRKTGHFHPSTLIRAASLRMAGGYRPQYEWVEDHDLWLRLAEYGQLANLSEVVLCYRQHAKSICWQRSMQQRELMNRLLIETYQRRRVELPPGVILEEQRPRAAAGPGKWARAAVRGGYISTAWKHLRQLNQSQARWDYKFRMNAEILARMLAQALAGQTIRSAAIRVPHFENWHRRWQEFESRKCAV